MDEKIYTDYYKLGEDIYISAYIDIAKYLRLNVDAFEVLILVHCLKKGDAVVLKEISVTSLHFDLWEKKFDNEKFVDVAVTKGARSSFDELKKMGILK